MIRWEKLKNTDRRVIDRIIDRLIEYGYRDNAPIDRLSATMDIAATHLLAPLRLEDLLKADEFNFKHDVYGILNHIDRNTGELKDCFSPRFSVRSLGQMIQLLLGFLVMLLIHWVRQRL